MKKNLLILFTSVMLAFYACGPSAEQKAAMEKAKMDSVAAAVKRATEDSLNLSKEMAEFSKRKRITEDAIGYFSYVLSKIDSIKTRAQSDMEGIKSFHWLRSADEKEAEISSQMNKEKQIENKFKEVEIMRKIFKKAFR